jgi:hypothetical protein
MAARSWLELRIAVGRNRPRPDRALPRRRVRALVTRHRQLARHVGADISAPVSRGWRVRIIPAVSCRFPRGHRSPPQSMGRARRANPLPTLIVNKIA